jgi:ferritin-like protein
MHQGFDFVFEATRPELLRYLGANSAGNQAEDLLQNLRIADERRAHAAMEAPEMIRGFGRKPGPRSFSHALLSLSCSPPGALPAKPASIQELLRHP